MVTLRITRDADPYFSLGHAARSFPVMGKIPVGVPVSTFSWTGENSRAGFHAAAHAQCFAPYANQSITLDSSVQKSSDWTENSSADAGTRREAPEEERHASSLRRFCNEEGVSSFSRVTRGGSIGRTFDVLLHTSVAFVLALFLFPPLPYSLSPPRTRCPGLPRLPHFVFRVCRHYLLSRLFLFTFPSV